jgi:molybdenum cofactor synthesis domain-containing protein
VFKVAIITISDKGFRGQRQDESGPAIERLLQEQVDYIVQEKDIVPDEVDLIKEKLLLFSDGLGCDLILTSGGTGLAPRDVTPEATKAVLDREIIGMSEAMRSNSMAITPTAMLSRAVCGVRGKSIIINLPGSPKGAVECLQVLLPVLRHACELVQGKSGDCGRH